MNLWSTLQKNKITEGSVSMDREILSSSSHPSGQDILMSLYWYLLVKGRILGKFFFMLLILHLHKCNQKLTAQS